MAAASSVVQSAAIFQLPAEISSYMLGLLPSAALASAARVCKLWSQLCADILPARHAQLCLAGIENALTGHDRYEPPVSETYKHACSAYWIGSLTKNPEIKTKTSVIERWKTYTSFFSSNITGMIKNEMIIHEAIRRLIFDNRSDHLQALLGSTIRNCLDSDATAIYIPLAARLDRRACLSHLLKDRKMCMQEEPPLPLKWAFNPVEIALNAALFDGCTECATLLLENVEDPAQAIRNIQTDYSASVACYRPESIAFMESILNPDARGLFI